MTELSIQGIKVRFAVIEGSKWGEPSWQSNSASQARVLVEDVEAEARRRLRSCKISDYRTREFLTGQPMPDAIRHFALQVEFAAQAIARLSPIPDDFDSDVYWPQML
ncbi:hypothetical protein SAMN05428969_3661 [Devosia sp. YR412]|nr:hypothetical protein SAMN05428969_3661 [Devosia sp. YR412]